MTSSQMGRRYIEEARGRLELVRLAMERDRFATVVREAQECVELLLKGALRIVAIEPARTHDVSEVLRRESAAFPSGSESRSIISPRFPRNWLATVALRCTATNASILDLRISSITTTPYARSATSTTWPDWPRGFSPSTLVAASQIRKKFSTCAGHDPGWLTRVIQSSRSTVRSTWAIRRPSGLRLRGFGSLPPDRMIE